MENLSLTCDLEVFFHRAVNSLAVTSSELSFVDSTKNLSLFISFPASDGNWTKVKVLKEQTTLELSFILLEIPNDAYIRRLILVGCSLLSQNYCKLIGPIEK